jgi:hypothetical protein
MAGCRQILTPLALHSPNLIKLKAINPVANDGYLLEKRTPQLMTG